ncbi:hypothetical protein U879_08915 [Defluviimonas sp. 20V17]|uniref:Trehalose-6-phosphate synthase n=1 Tax=Allgaiera indica TaxID=765699 RepID=A0AAN4UVD0_9RHOB|nr:trehalose-6-phosphate synthase [Allgaiera indica]KDB04036.1 hypothetical protein U879_08915 [Defluviimonas sp. 20V17]GHE06606.1 hypothetical protein GCM10008024_41340 [Allgaiera indica]
MVALHGALSEQGGLWIGAHAELDWTPIRYIHRAVDRDKLALLYRMARIGLVTSFADGMNLVAKEYVAAQDPEDPGVLILSRFAGAAEDMKGALLVNPYDIQACALAIDEAFHMPREERLRRHKINLSVVERTDVSTWAAQFLSSLAEAPTTPEAATRRGKRLRIPGAERGLLRAVHRPI